jgi:hypothetical protein
LRRQLPCTGGGDDDLVVDLAVPLERSRGVHDLDDHGPDRSSAAAFHRERATEDGTESVLPELVRRREPSRRAP